MKKFFLALPFLLAGCQSERVAFQFQPGPPAVGAAPVRQSRHPQALAAQPEAATPQAAPSSAETAAQPSAPRAARPPRLRFAAGSRLLPPLAPTTRPTTPALADAPPLSRPALRQLVRQRATAGPARTTESGLGGIALFFIAVVLGLLAGLGALVSLIFGTGFFTGVGFAAAGLLVLFLLYLLLSGGKHKKPVAPSK